MMRTLCSLCSASLYETIATTAKASLRTTLIIVVGERLVAVVFKFDKGVFDEFSNSGRRTLFWTDAHTRVLHRKREEQVTPTIRTLHLHANT